MKCIIVDDEPLARQGLSLNVGEVAFLENVGEFGSAMEANDFLQTEDVDVIFLDIEMPGMSGLDFIRTLRKEHLVILTTAYPQFALEGFELDVVDYLLKPIRLERFIRAVNKAKEIFDLQQLSPATVEEVRDEYIYIKSDRKYHKVFFQEILFIRGMKDYVMVHTNSQKLPTAMNIKTIFNQLPQNIFARVSKSYLVNVEHIRRVDHDVLFIENIEIPLGKTYREDFINTHITDRLLKRS